MGLLFLLEEQLLAMLTSSVSLAALLMVTLLLMIVTVVELLAGLTPEFLFLRPSSVKLFHSEYMFIPMPQMLPLLHPMELLLTINNLLARTSYIGHCIVCTVNIVLLSYVLYALHCSVMYYMHCTMYNG